MKPTLWFRRVYRNIRPLPTWLLNAIVLSPLIIAFTICAIALAFIN